MNAPSAAAPAPSPFAEAHADLAALGWHCVPLLPFDFLQHRGRGKAPGEVVSGGWRGMDKWQRLRTSPPSAFELGLWSRAKGANIGLVLGSPAGAGFFSIAVDVDSADPDVVDEIVRALPHSNCQKVGAKGLTLLFKAPDTIKSKAYDDERIPRDAGVPRRLVDLLTGFATKQTVAPPSVHPDGPVYRWVKGPVAPQDLVVFDEDALTKLEEVLSLHGWGAERPTDGRERRPYVAADHDDGDVFSEVKRAALANIGAWVHDVPNIGDLRPARGGYEGINLMRDSSSGAPLSQRKRNLSIQGTGIRDFGTNQGWSAIDLVSEFCDLSVSEAVTWLEDRLGMGDASDVVIDLDAFRASCERKAETETAPAVSEETTEAVREVSAGHGGSVVAGPVAATHDSSGELPAHLLRVPGIVGQATDWIVATSRKPQPVLALAMGLAVIGTVAGRKFAGPTESATHNFFLCTAGTGAGKNAPKKAAAQLLNKAGLRHLIGPSSFQSASALIQHVSRQPASLCVMDEFSMLIGKINSRNNSNHERAISGEMRQMWTLSFEEYFPPRWADSANRQQPQPISSPALSLYGLTTPDELYSVLQGADVLSGFLNRFVLFATSTNPEDRDPTASVFEPPADLVEGLKSIAGTGGPLAQATMHADCVDAPLIVVPWEDGPGGRAHAVFKELAAEMSNAPDHEALRQRTAEIAVRLATVRAIGVSGENAKVTVEDMQWGAEVARWSTDRLIADVDRHMVESDHQTRAKLVLRLIQDQPGGTINRTALCRLVNHRFDGKTLETVLVGLQDAGQIEINSSTRTGSGPKAKTYRAL